MSAISCEKFQEAYKLEEIETISNSGGGLKEEKRKTVR